MLLVPASGRASHPIRFVPLKFKRLFYAQSTTERIGTFPFGIRVSTKSQVASRLNRVSRASSSTFSRYVENQKISLRDGRILGFAEYGKLTGKPAFYFHPALGSRYDGFALDKAGSALGIRIICPDRPGHGLSSFQNHRTLPDYPTDIVDLAEHLRLKRFFCIGESAGGPYALVSARFLPKEQLAGVGILAGIGPWKECKTLYPSDMARSMTLTKWFPLIMKIVNEFTYAAARRGDDHQLRRSYRQFMGLPTSDEGKSLESDPEEDLFVQSLIEALRQGQKGHMHDSKIFTSDWGYALEDIRSSIPLILYYGTNDDRVPLSVGRYLAQAIRSSELNVIEGATHFSISECYHEILQNLLSRDAAQGW